MLSLVHCVASLHMCRGPLLGIFTTCELLGTAQAWELQGKGKERKFALYSTGDPVGLTLGIRFFILLNIKMLECYIVIRCLVPFLLCLRFKLHAVSGF